MKKNTIQLIKIEPNEGYYLTQKELHEGEERIFSSCIYLGIYDSEENWTEWSEEEKMKFEENG